MKRLGKAMALGALLGILLLLVQHVLRISTDTFLRVYWIVAAVILVGVLLFNFFYIHSRQKKMRDAAVLLEAGKTQEYIEAVDALRRRAKGRYLKQLFTVNLSAGYCEAGQHDQAIALLETLSTVRLNGILKLVYCLNLCTCYFYSHEQKKAMALYESAQREFHLFQNSPLYGAHIAVLDVFAALEQGELSRADTLLKNARETWNNSRVENDYCYLEKQLQEAQSRHSG